MDKITLSQEWQALQAHQSHIGKIPMREMFSQDEQRFEKFSLQHSELFLDYSKNIITTETLTLLCQLAERCHLEERIQQLFAGYPLNNTENRPALHTALRNFSGGSIFINDKDIMPPIQANLASLTRICHAIHTRTWRGFSGKPFTDVVNIGIGGSDLGPALVTEALSHFSLDKVRCHFVSNIDGTHLTNTLKQLHPETTLFIVSSKSFTTLETLTNAAAAKAWLGQATKCDKGMAQHFIAVTQHRQKALQFGIAAENILDLWEWVGGRYSLWSAVGLPIALSIGSDNFKELLAGAHAMDQHFLHTPLLRNMPVIMGLLGVWYTNFFGSQTHAILPYDQYLKRLPAYLQQADMESNGKQTRCEGSPTDYTTGPVIWGEVGCNGQHAFHQLLHQGTHLIPTDFIIALRNHHALGTQHDILFANCLSQSQALMQGKTYTQAHQELLAAGLNPQRAALLAAHKTVPGNRPSNTLLLPQLTPRTLGALLALYEHKIFVQGIIWGINSFDQWGIELGKELINEILPSLTNPSTADFDTSTQGLIQLYSESRNLTAEKNASSFDCHKV